MAPQRKAAVELEIDSDVYGWLKQKAEEQGVTIEEYTASCLEQIARAGKLSVTQT